MASFPNIPGASNPKAEPPREVDLVREATAAVADRLPNGWEARLREALPVGGTRADGLLTIVAPSGATGAFVMEAKRLISTRDVPGVIQDLRLASESLARLAVNGDAIRSSEPMVVARYLAPSTREAVAAVGGSYVDATGNVLVRLHEPAVFLRDQGANRDPWRGPGRPLGTLQGAPAARVARALIDFVPPVSVPELIQRSGASSGATYRVVKFLEEEALLTRVGSQIVEVDWRGLLDRWSKDYGFDRSNTVRRYLEPRGLPKLLDSLRLAQGLTYLLTGSPAAARLAPYAPSRLAMLYVDDFDEAAACLQLREVDAGANVLLATTNYDVVFERPDVVDGVRYAAPSQVVVDLRSGPGRSSSEADRLVRWMGDNEQLWRR